MLENDDEDFLSLRVNGRGEVARKEKKAKAAPEPDDAVTEIVRLDDFIARNGRPHKMVRATWNYPRQLTATELMILSYFRQHRFLVDRNGGCIGFEGRAVDYNDYAAEHEKA